MTTIDIHLGGQAVKIDLDRLTPVAHDLASAIVAALGRTTVDIWMEADQPIRDTVPNWELWYSPDEGNRPERRPWRGWSDLPLGPAEDPHARLEHEAAKIPVGWHVYGPNPDAPLPDRGPVREATAGQVLAWLNARGRNITAATWRSYVSRQQAPQPARRIERTPVWNMDEIKKWHIGWEARATMTRRLVDNGIAGQGPTAFRLDPTT